MNKKSLQEVIKQQLLVSNYTSIEEARGLMTTDQWQSFWEITAQTLMDNEHQKCVDQGQWNSWAPEEAWQKSWDLIEANYPKYIRQPLCGNT